MSINRSSGFAIKYLFIYIISLAILIIAIYSSTLLRTSLHLGTSQNDKIDKLLHEFSVLDWSNSEKSVVRNSRMTESADSGADEKLKLLTETKAVFVSPIAGLGNKLFQVASAYALSRRTNATLFICTDDTDDLEMLDFFGITAPRLYCNLPSLQSKPCSFDHVNEKSLYNGTLPETRFIRLGAYFASNVYFKDYKSEILEQFAMNSPLVLRNSKPEMLELAKQLKRSFFSVAVHVRRGDFLTENAHWALPIEYQVKAIKQILRDVPHTTFYIFSDDIPYAKSRLDDDTLFHGVRPRFVYVTGNVTKTNLEDMYLMSLCRYIIVANSTFSWWAAYLGRATKVIAPKPRYDPEYYKTMWTDEETRIWKKFLYSELAYPTDWTTINPFSV